MFSRLRKALIAKGLPEGRGLFAHLANDTGYSAASFSVAFNNEKISDKLLRALCRTYQINEDWVRTGEGRMFCSQKIRVYDLAERFTIDHDELMDRLHAVGIQTTKTKESVSISDTATAEVRRIVRTIPVISKVQAGDNGFWDDCYPVGEGLEHIDCPYDINDVHAFALLIDGDSMIPFARHGNIVIVDTTKPYAKGDEVVVRLKDGRTMCKIYKNFDGGVIFSSYNLAYEDIYVSPQDIECCFAVKYVRKN